MIKTFDINSDVGEGVNNEMQLMPYLSSCNIACGGHAGDKRTMESVVLLAIKHNVKIGAHPSYPDRVNFGRAEIDIADVALKESIREQVGRVSAFAKAYKTSLHHIKPHGALYNKAAREEATAKLIVETVLSIDDSLTLYVPFNSVIAAIAQGKLRTKIEGFADRAYNADYSLVSRNRNGAVLEDATQVIAHCTQMIDGQLTTIDGQLLPFTMDTLCVHGDNAQALKILECLTGALNKANIQIS